jgi:hypothetical protein
MNYTEHIAINPEKRFGKPTIIGCRISVHDGLSWRAGGKTLQILFQIFRNSPKDRSKPALLMQQIKRIILLYVNNEFFSLAIVL